MAKNENKKGAEAVTNEKSDVILVPEKIAEPSHKKPERPEPPHKKHHGWRKFVFFIFVLLLGGVAFLAVQLDQTRKSNVDTLQKLQTAYDDKIGVLESRMNVLNREVNALKERPVVEHAAGVSENLVNQKIAALRDEIVSQLLQNTPAANSSDNKTAKSVSGVAGESSRDLLAPEVAILTANEKKTQEILLASGAIIVRELAEQSMSFVYEAEVLQILARGNELAENYVRTVRKFANTGVTGKQQLISSFEKVFAELNDAHIKPEVVVKNETENQNWYEKVWMWLKQVVAVKKREKKPVFKAEDDEVSALVHEGRLQDALNALKISEKYAKIDSKPLHEWKLQTEQYLEFNQAINGLIMNALANIRLKELEHAAE